MELRDKTVVVTGASSGIGLDLIRELSHHGCRILAVARTIGKINIDLSGVIPFACDISTPENVDRLFEAAFKTLGGIDIFVANAGFAYYELIRQADWSRIEKIFRTNVFSSIYTAEKMKDLHGGQPYRMVITASGMSFLSIPGYSLYSSTKAALHGFACAYRYELKPGQQLQMVYPIATKTSFFEEAGSGIPVPWPRQDSATVARAIVDGIERDRNTIMPSKLFLMTHFLGRLLPLVNTIYQKIEARKLFRWLETSAG